MALFGGGDAIRTEARRVLDAFGPVQGHVFNLGHGISRFTPPEAVANWSMKSTGTAVRCGISE